MLAAVSEMVRDAGLQQACPLHATCPTAPRSVTIHACYSHLPSLAASIPLARCLDPFSALLALLRCLSRSHHVPLYLSRCASLALKLGALAISPLNPKL